MSTKNVEFQVPSRVFFSEFVPLLRFHIILPGASQEIFDPHHKQFQFLHFTFVTCMNVPSFTSSLSFLFQRGDKIHSCDHCYCDALWLFLTRQHPTETAGCTNEEPQYQLIRLNMKTTTLFWYVLPISGVPSILGVDIFCTTHRCQSLSSAIVRRTCMFFYSDLTYDVEFCFAMFICQSSWAVPLDGNCLISIMVYIDIDIMYMYMYSIYLYIHSTYYESIWNDGL